MYGINMPKIDWNQAAVLKLIEQWSKNDCLYNTTNGLYHNKHARSAALHRICVHVKKILPNVKANDVKIKINYLRSQYGRELLKVRESRRSGIRDDVYIPTAYWFEHLHFLKDFMNVRKDTSNLSLYKNVAPKSDVVGQSDHTNCSVKAEKSNCREFEDSNVNENAYNEEAVDVRNTKRKRPRINTTQILARSPESNSTTFSEKNSFVSHVTDTQAQQQLEPFESYQAPTSNNNSTLDINDDIEINDEDLINIENDLGVIQNLMPRSKASMQLEEELTKAETEYYRCKADYFTKLAENSKIKRTLMLLESRKLQLEIEQLTHN